MGCTESTSSSAVDDTTPQRESKTHIDTTTTSQRDSSSSKYANTSKSVRGSRDDGYFLPLPSDGMLLKKQPLDATPDSSPINNSHHHRVEVPSTANLPSLNICLVADNDQSGGRPNPGQEGSSKQAQPAQACEPSMLHADSSMSPRLAWDKSSSMNGSFDVTPNVSSAGRSSSPQELIPHLHDEPHISPPRDDLQLPSGTISEAQSEVKSVFSSDTIDQLRRRSACPGETCKEPAPDWWKARFRFSSTILSRVEQGGIIGAPAPPSHLVRRVSEWLQATTVEQVE